MNVSRRSVVTDPGSRLRSRPGPHSRRVQPGSAAGVQRSGRPCLPWRSCMAWQVLLLVLAVIVTVLLALTMTVNLGDRHGSSAARPGDRRGSSSDPFSGQRLFVDPYSPVAQAEASLERSDPAAAALLR